MCGIAGYIGFSEIDESKLIQTCEVMKNRGPDVQEYKTYSCGSKIVYLLHSRLSIIDLEERANQPFSFDRLHLVFNGEIYNYIEVREELKKENYSFETNSDTEVLIKAYHRWGKECVHKFEGMWSFAIFDERKHELFLSRDRFAEKPLYFVKKEDGFYFASEIKFLKALLPENSLNVNYDMVKRYLINGYKSIYKSKETFFDEVDEVKFATNLTIDEKFQIKQNRYWTPSYNPRSMSIEEAVEGFKNKFLRSMELRLRSDVPLAFCLSGGIDSSSIISTASKVFNYKAHAFSIIDKDERYNEESNILATVKDLGCEYTPIVVEKEKTLKRLEDLVDYHDAPVATISYYIHSFLLREISQRDFRVSFSGTAADELVTGYYDHFNQYLYETRNSPNHSKYVSDWKNGIGKHVRNPFLQQPDLFIKDPSFRNHIYLNNDYFSSLLVSDFKEDFSEEKLCGKTLLRNRMMNEIFYEATPVVLHEDDLNSMFYSIENRSPYLDKELFEFSYSIPTEYLIQDGYGKYILREAMNGILNDEVRLDKQKKGFNASIHSLFDFSEGELVDYIMDGKRIFDVFDRDKIGSLLKQKEMPNSFSKFIFYFLSSMIFLEKNG